LEVPDEFEELEEPEGGDVVEGITGRKYPASWCCRPGDKLADSLSEEQNAEGEFVVERIMDEISMGRNKTLYLVKWKGYQLRPGGEPLEVDELLATSDWEPYGNVRDCDAFKRWLKQGKEGSRPGYFKEVGPVRVVKGKVEPMPAKR
jgi:hypothetical protein